MTEVLAGKVAVGIGVARSIGRATAAALAPARGVGARRWADGLT